MRQRQRLRLRQGHHLRALEEPAQVAVLRPLKDNVQLVAVDEGSFKPDDTRVRRQRLQQLDLLDAPLSRLRIHRVEDRDLLERDSLRVRIAGCTVHDGEVAAADGLLHGEVVQRAAAEVEARRAGGAIGHALQRSARGSLRRVLLQRELANTAPSLLFSVAMRSSKYRCTVQFALKIARTSEIRARVTLPPVERKPAREFTCALPTQTA